MPKTAQPWVSTLVRTIFEQAGAASLRAQHAQVVQGQSRTLAWGRRPEAARLVALLADPDGGWDAIVVGEYERAFYGSQYASMARCSSITGCSCGGRRPGRFRV